MEDEVTKRIPVVEMMDVFAIRTDGDWWDIRSVKNPDDLVDQVEADSEEAALLAAYEQGQANLRNFYDEEADDVEADT